MKFTLEEIAGALILATQATLPFQIGARTSHIISTPCAHTTLLLPVAGIRFVSFPSPKELHPSSSLAQHGVLQHLRQQLHRRIRNIRCTNTPAASSTVTAATYVTPAPQPEAPPLQMQHRPWQLHRHIRNVGRSGSTRKHKTANSRILASSVLSQHHN